METTVQSERRVRFGPFELNLATRELSQSGMKIRLQGHPMDVLILLLEHPGAVVSREVLQKRLWPQDTFVDFKHGLDVTINRLREALGDQADEPEFVETLPRVGYRFIAPVESASVETPAAPANASAALSEPPVPDAVRSSTLQRWMVWGTWAFLALVAIAIGAYRFGMVGRPAPYANRIPAIGSIAVLPLESLSRDPEQDYFADGMTDALLTDLGGIGSLRVISRQSIMQYKHSTKSLPQIARELNADAIVEGTVQRSGDRMKVSVQLLLAKTDRHLWAQSYERNSRDALTIQGEVARDVAEAIRAKLSPAESRRLSVPHSIDPEAYENYLKGRYEFYKFSSQSLDKAGSYFRSALQKDPSFALAYAGLADVWLMRTDSGGMLPSEAAPKAKDAAVNATQLDDSLAEPHVTLGNLYALYERNWAAGEREFLRAIELNPNSIDAHFMYADFLISLKRNQEWDTEIHKTLALDPMSSFTRTFYGWHLIYLGRCDEAIEILNEVISLQPNSSSAHLGLWGAHWKKHMDGEAMQEAVRFFEGLHDQEAATALREGFSRAGYRGGMRDAANVLAARAKHDYVPAIRIARLYAHAGDANNAIAFLRIADQNRETPMGHLGVGWDWDPLRGDPRFQELMRHMNFPK